MYYPLLLVPAALVATLLVHPDQSGGWLWDVGNGLGYLAFAGLLYLFVDVGFGSRHRHHQWVGYVVLGAVFGHVLVLWLPDATLWHYTSIDAPWYMLVGLVAAGVLIAGLTVALPATRRYWHASHRAFRRWHYWLAMLILILTAAHILGSAFYLADVEKWLLVTLAAAAVLAPYLLSAETAQRKFASFPAWSVSALISLTLFIGVRGWFS